MKAMAVEGRHTDTCQRRETLPGHQAPKHLAQTHPSSGGRETWNVEVWSVDVKAGGHWGILLVLHLPVLRRELGEWQDPR